jgi:hypothetical protein
MAATFGGGLSLDELVTLRETLARLTAALNTEPDAAGASTERKR